VPGSEVPLVDFPNIGSAIWHMGGAIRFGADEKIYVGVGDHQQPPKAQLLDNVFGKILRFNPDGSIPTDNPFFNTTSGVNRSIWCYGLRNPFTFDLQPGTGKLFINDVGDGAWEEVDEGIKGANYGWPLSEGDFNQPDFPTHTRPAYAYPHDQGQCITGAVFYNPATIKFPAQYVGKYFFTDFSVGFMKTIDPVTRQVTSFATGLNFPTDASVAPDGSIYFLQRGENTGDPTTGFGSIHKLDYVLDTPPSIIVPPSGQSKAVGQQATFAVVASGTAPLSYQWQRNAQTIAGATSELYTFTVQAADAGAVYRCVVTNAINSATSAGATLTLLPGHAPVATIETPAADFTWTAGQTIQFSGSATDQEDSSIPPSAFTWHVEYVTGSVARPLVPPTSGSTSGSFVAPDNSPYTATTVAFRITLKVTDSDGVVTTTTRDVLPKVSNVTLRTNVPGLSLKLDGTPRPSGYSVNGVVNLLRLIEAPLTQTLGGSVYRFVNWSDSGSRVHTINWPAVNSTFTANYALVTDVFLSDLTPTLAQNAWGPYERDRSNGETAAGDGGPITLKGQTYAKGLGTHAPSELRYNLVGGNYTEFRADIGIDDEAGSNGSAIFQVWVDGVMKYASPLMTGNSTTQSVVVDVNGGGTLRLVVTDGGVNFNTWDHADWANARLIGAGGGPPPTSLFNPVVRYSTGTSAHGVFAADLNGDTKIDLAVANAGSNTVSVLFGNGDGTFAAPTNYGVGGEPKSVQAKDFNGDGKLDLVTANQGPGTVSVLINNGNGTFASSVSYTATAGAHEATSNDLDGDGDNDIAVVGWGASVLRVLMNNGNGTFTVGPTYSVGQEPHSVVAFDFNGDNKPDLANVNWASNSVSVLINTGNGTYQNAVFYPVGGQPHSIRAADLNGDGRLDLVTANEATNNMSVLLGNANGTFQAAVHYATGPVPKGVGIGDVNNDGKLDILSANTAGNYPNSNNPGGDTFSVLFGNGNGTFNSATSYTTGRTPFSLALADFDNDGDLDVASANWHTSDVGVLLNTTSDTTGNSAPTVLPDSATTEFNQAMPIDVLANDFDLDGSIDPTSVYVSTQPQHGATTVDPITGIITYTPTPGYGGPDQFFYNVLDNLGASSAAAKVSITVTGAPQTLVYLSDLTPTLAQNGFGPYERDTSNGEVLAGDGHTIMLNGQTFARGIGVHAPSELTYNLVHGNYTEFRASIGIDDEAGSNGSAIFQVWVDGVLKYTSPLMTATSTTQQVFVNVVGANTLRLVVTDGGVNTNLWDHGDWADARLMLALPTAPDLSAASDSGVSNSDDLTNVATPTFTGTAPAGATVRVLSDGVVVATTTATAGGTWSAQTSLLPDGAHQITVAYVNVDLVVTPASDPVSITIDTAAPQPPPQLNLVAASDSGSSSNDDYTSDTTPAFDVVSSGAYFRIFRGGAQIGGDYESGNSFTATTTPQGLHSFAIRAVDPAGNVSALGPGLDVTIDVTAPVITNPGNQQFEIVSTAGTNVNYTAATASDNLTTTPLVQHVAPPGASFLPGTTPVNVVATDLAGNVSNASFNITLVDAPFIVRGAGAAYAFSGAAGAQTLTISAGTVTFVANAEAYKSGLSVDVTGGGLVMSASQSLHSLHVGSGASAVLSASGSHVLVTELLSITGTGHLDLADNALIVDYTGESPLATIQSLVSGGYAGGAWNGNGINSSSAAATPGRALGLAEATDLGSPPSFEGYVIDSTAVLVRYTIAGDADLNGAVNVNDLGLLATNWQQSPRRWGQGDFDFNGTVDVNDLGILASNWQQGSPAPTLPMTRRATNRATPPA
jgi:hypothetical protein